MLEIKHATYFSGIGLDMVPLIEADLRRAGWADGELPLVLEAFESTVLTRLRARGIRGSYVYLIEAAGRPFDMVAAFGKAALDVPRDDRAAWPRLARRVSSTASASTSA